MRKEIVNIEEIKENEGKLEIVIENGWKGVMMNEEVGNGIEGDLKRKKK